MDRKNVSVLAYGWLNSKLWLLICIDSRVYIHTVFYQFWTYACQLYRFVILGHLGSSFLTVGTILAFFQLDGNIVYKTLCMEMLNWCKKISK